MLIIQVGSNNVVNLARASTTLHDVRFDFCQIIQVAVAVRLQQVV